MGRYPAPKNADLDGNWVSMLSHVSASPNGRYTLKAEQHAAQSHQRRFSRWLHNPRLNVQRLSSPIIQSALAAWGGPVLVLIEDTTMLWNRYCLVRISVRYRGRAVPVAWRVLEHKSSSLRFEVYQGLQRAGSKTIACWNPSSVSSRSWREPTPH